MGETVSFTSNGDEVEGYLAVPSAGSGPGLLVVQEWWGLVPQIKRVADRLASEGFVALAPDLYHGEIAEHTEMDKAAQLMTTLPTDRAARDMAGAIDYLLAHPAVTGDAVGVDRVLHGRHAHARDRRAAGRQGRRRGAVLRRTARRLRARLVEPAARRCSATSPRTTTSSRPTRSASSSRSCGGWARTSCSKSSPTPATRSPTRTTRSAPTTRKRPTRPGPRHRFLHTRELG